MKVAIALHSQEMMNADTGFDLIRLVAQSMGPGKRIWLVNPQRARKEIANRESVELALKHGADHVLFIKDGTRILPESLERLAHHNQDFVGCKYNKELPGTELALVKTSVFEKLDKPWFRPDYVKGRNDYTDDDVIFIKSLADKGFQILQDTQLSEENKRLKTPKYKVNGNDLKVNVAVVQGQKIDGPTIAICIPTQDKIWTHTAFDTSLMCANVIGLVNSIILINPQGERIEYSRNVSVEIAQEQKAEQILFIDSDMRFPADTLVRLRKRKKDIIGVNAAKRDGTNVPVMRKNLFKRRFNYKKGGTEQVEYLGMAVTLLNMSVFDECEKPYFYANFKQGKDEWRGEDYTFCWEAKRKGFHVWCDVGLSKEIGHIGARAYYLKDTDAYSEKNDIDNTSLDTRTRI